MTKHWLSLIPLLLVSLTSNAQSFILQDTPEVAEDTTHVSEVRLAVRAAGYFHDNEYDRGIVDGYTLPGARVMAAFTYDPIKAVHLELGCYGMFFSGANKYPNWAYHDVASWKGNEYTSGMHILPWFRASMKIGRSRFVLGDIYGGTNHRIVEELYNPEQNLTRDPEMGLQYMLDYKYNHLDAWVDWQSFIYKLDSHQEAFVFGLTDVVKWKTAKPVLSDGTPRSNADRLTLETPITLMAQHRGGEIDSTSMGTQTLWNMSASLRADYTPRWRFLSNIQAEASVMYSWQQVGELWPFKSGMALGIKAQATAFFGLTLSAGYFYAPKHFMSLYGCQFFSTYSYTQPELDITRLSTVHYGIAYRKVLAKHYELGIYGKAFHYLSPAHKEFDFSFGAYINVSPSFLIKSFKQHDRTSR